MFGFFDAFARRINEQVADYAATQAEILKRNFALWQAPAPTARLVRVENTTDVARHMRRLASQGLSSRAR